MPAPIRFSTRSRSLSNPPLRRLASRFASVLALGLLLVGLGASPAAAASPAFAVHSIAAPSHFPAGASTGIAGYAIEVKNVGAAPTDGTPITITDALPAGLSLHPGTGANLLQFALDWNDEEALTSLCDPGPPLTCMTPTTPIGPSGARTFDSVLKPGATLTMFVPLDVGPPAVEGTAPTNHLTVSGGGAAPVSLAEDTPVSATPAPFGFQDSSFSLTDPDGNPQVHAGSHPNQLNTYFLLNSAVEGRGRIGPAGELKDVGVKLPPGLVVDPQATPVRCTAAQLESNDGDTPLCPDASAVGVFHAVATAFGNVIPGFSGAVFNMVPPPGVPAEFGFEYGIVGNEIFVHILGGVDSAGDYRLTAEVPNINEFGGATGADLDFWGSPSDPSHDSRRGRCATAVHIEDGMGVSGGDCPVLASDTPLLTMPSACSGPLATSFSADSWQEPGNFLTASASTEDSSGTPVGVSGCSALEFNPTLKARPTTNTADSPSGLEVDLHVPQTESLGQLATANLKDTTVTLPEGLVVNPAAANGLDAYACSAAQIGLATPPGSTPIHFSAAHPSCPDAAKLGTVEVDTPLLEDPLPGAVYVAKPFDNPFNSLLALYIVVDDPASGVLIKLAGHVVPDPVTGRLTASFEENPQLPFEDFKLDFFGGPNGPLRTPATCGPYSTTSSLAPWSGNPPASPHDDYSISQSPSGASCPSTPAAQPNSPAFDAGTLTPIAGAYSPFVLNLRREDGSQQFSRLTLTTPPGLVAKLAATPACPDQALAAAAAKSGRAELASPSCPGASQIGTVNVAAGAGPAPYNAPGSVYLAGPYQGAPLSLAVITPAVAGPFDLGTVLVRAALHIDPTSAQITAVSDPIPQILAGIPLDLRSVQLHLDKPQFTLNGTSCDPLALSGSLLSGLGQTVPLSKRFQLGECGGLPFKPKLSLLLKGSTKRTANPALIATLRAKPGEANTAFAQVTLPHAAFLDNAHLGLPCTRVQFAAGGGGGEGCPPSSLIGRATAITPLLGYPLTANVYLRTNPAHKLPDLLVAFQGPPSQPIRFELAGKTDSVKGALRNTFETAPDVPVSSFRLELFGGRKGLIELSNGLCADPTATVRLIAHNGKSHESHPAVRASCAAKGKKGGHGSRPQRRVR
jgi:uncharacterized repeat protein (TIGR01451 family)